MTTRDARSLLAAVPPQPGCLERRRNFRRNVLSATACGLLLILVGQFIVPLLAVKPCGVIVPHEHVLLGHVSAIDLRRHLAAEAHCARGKPDAPEPQAARLRASRGVILNVVAPDQGQAGPRSMLHCATADLPPGMRIVQVWPPASRLEPIQIAPRSVIFSPPNPPPEAV